MTADRYRWSIPGVHRGVRMASQLEVQLARFLDQHRIAWEYEPEVFPLGPRRSYLPDFHLPGVRAWVECKGAMWGKDRFKMGAVLPLLRERGENLLLARYPVPVNLSLVRPVVGGPVVFDEFDLVQARCVKCERWYFADGGAVPWECPACGACEQDSSHVGAIHPHGGRRRWVGDLCRECGAVEAVLVRRDWGRW